MSSTLPPQGLNSLAAIRPALRDLLISHSFTVTFVILLSALFYFSSPATRKRPVFVLNVTTLILALVVGTILDYVSITSILSPQRLIPVSLSIIVGTLGVVQYILVDTTLLLRLLSVYPRSYVGRNRFLLLLITPILLKLLRLVNLTVFIAVLARAAQSGDPFASVESIWTRSPHLKVEWIAQSVDNAYASSLFLLSLSRRRKSNRDSGEVSFGRASFAQRLRVIFWLSIYSFVFPLLFSITQLVVAFRAVSPFTINDILLCNTCVAVIGVVFASVWVESEAWIEERYLRNSQFSEDKDIAKPVFVVGGRPLVISGPMPMPVGGSGWGGAGDGDGPDVEDWRQSTVSYTSTSVGQRSTFLSLGSVSRNVFAPARS